MPSSRTSRPRRSRWAVTVAMARWSRAAVDCFVTRQASGPLRPQLVDRSRLELPPARRRGRTPPEGVGHRHPAHPPRPRSCPPRADPAPGARRSWPTAGLLDDQVDRFGAAIGDASGVEVRLAHDVPTFTHYRIRHLLGTGVGEGRGPAASRTVPSRPRRRRSCPVPAAKRSHWPYDAVAWLNRERLLSMKWRIRVPVQA